MAWRDRNARSLIGRTFAETMVLTPVLRPIAVRRLQVLLRRRESRVGSFLAYHVGEALARRAVTTSCRIRTGSRIMLDLRDRAHRQIYFTGVYEPPLTRLVSRLATRGWTVLDVGANAGYFTRLAQDLGGPSAIVHAFEPNPALTRLLRRQASTSSSPVIVEAACGAAPGEATFWPDVDPANTGLGTLVDGLNTKGTGFVVPVVRIDDHCASQGIVPDLVKIDAEGFEVEVLRGMPSLLSGPRLRAVICEVGDYPGRVAPADVLDLLSGCGWRGHTIRDDGSLGPLGQIDGVVNLCFVRPVSGCASEPGEIPAR